MRHDRHDGLRRGSRQPDPRADRLRGRLHGAEDVRRHRLHDRRPHGVGGQRRGWPDDPLLQGGDRGSPRQARCATVRDARARAEGLAPGRCRVGLDEASAGALGYAERRFRPRVAAEGEEVSSSDADAYDRFMGRYSSPLAVPFADFAGLPLDSKVLDVGCGPGALTAELARRTGPGRVTAVDPSEEFVAALRNRQPGVQVIRAPAEDLPFEGGSFAATLAQLVVNVMDDPVAGLREMARVTRDGGVVAACVWDFTDGGPIGPFWDAARALDPEVATGSVCPGSRAGHLADLFRAAGIGDIVDGAVAVDVEHATFEDWWERFTLGVAPSGAHVAGLEPDRCAALRELCRERLPEPPFVVSAKAWVARGAA